MPRNLRKADHVERESECGNEEERGANEDSSQRIGEEPGRAGPDRSVTCLQPPPQKREGGDAPGGRDKEGEGEGRPCHGLRQGERKAGEWLPRGGLVRPSYCCGSARTAIRGASARSASTKPACGHSHRFGGLSRRLHYLVSVGSGNECESATGEKVRDHDQDRRSACPPACHDLKISCRDKLEIREER